MAIEVIGEIIPKNNGKFPIVSAPNVSVTTSVNEATDSTANEGNLLRCSFRLGDPISLGSHTGYRINRLAVRAVAGTTVRFALYDVEENHLSRLAVLGDAVADSETQVAELSFAGGLEVKRDNTIILALAQEAAIHCLQLPDGFTTSGGVLFDDGDYFDHIAGAQIPWYDSAEAEGGPIVSAACARDIDFLTVQTLEEYTAKTDARLDQTIYPVESATSGQTLAPERHYVFGAVTALAVMLEQTDDGKAHEYWFEFEPAEGFAGLTISPMVRWMADPQYPVGKKCLVGIVRGMAVMGCG